MKTKFTQLRQGSMSGPPRKSAGTLNNLLRIYQREAYKNTRDTGKKESSQIAESAIKRLYTDIAKAAGSTETTVERIPLEIATKASIDIVFNNWCAKKGLQATKRSFDYCKRALHLYAKVEPEAKGIEQNFFTIIKRYCPTYSGKHRVVESTLPRHGGKAYSKGKPKRWQKPTTNRGLDILNPLPERVEKSWADKPEVDVEITKETDVTIITTKEKVKK
jgi:hypothetical protein